MFCHFWPILIHLFLIKVLMSYKKQIVPTPNVVYFFINTRNFCFVSVKVYIAAFAISGYATAQFRNRYKPFNPVLGETFECIREDRGFRYISEQVSDCHFWSYIRYVCHQAVVYSVVLCLHLGFPSSTHICMPCRIRKFQLLAGYVKWPMWCHEWHTVCLNLNLILLF